MKPPKHKRIKHGAVCSCNEPAVVKRNGEYVCAECLRKEKFLDDYHRETCGVGGSNGKYAEVYGG